MHPINPGIPTKNHDFFYYVEQYVKTKLKDVWLWEWVFIASNEVEANTYNCPDLLAYWLNYLLTGMSQNAFESLKLPQIPFETFIVSNQ